MGLDIVELVMRVEEEFVVDIPDQEAEEATTVGKLYALVLTKLRQPDRAACLTSAAFYRTRRAFLDALDIPKLRIRPATLVDSVIPERSRAAIWASVQRASPLALPDFETAWIVYGDVYPSGSKTFGELAKKVLALNYKRLKAECGAWNEREVWTRLCAIIVDQCGVKPEQVTAEASFVHDLNLE